MELTYSGEDKMGPETVGSVVGEQGTNSLSLRTMGGAGCVLRVSKVPGTKIYCQLRKGIEVLQNKLGADKGEKLGWGRGQLSLWVPKEHSDWETETKVSPWFLTLWPESGQQMVPCSVSCWDQVSPCLPSLVNLRSSLLSLCNFANFGLFFPLQQSLFFF